MSEKIFTKKNVDDLSDVCRRTQLLLKESINDGDLMMSQQLILADLIKEYADNPIVKRSGIIIKL